MSRSFGLDAPSALAALKDAVERLRDDDLNRDLARDCAIKAWHLCEHVFPELPLGVQFATVTDLQNHVKSSCPELGHLQVVCNASKHGELLRNTGEVEAARYHHGDFSRDDFSSDDFDTGGLVIELTDGQTALFNDAVGRALAYWSQFFEDHGLG